MTDNTTRLREANEALAEACARRDAISQRMRELSTTADQRRDGVRSLEQPRQERKGLVAQLLRLGRGATADEGARLNALADAAASNQAGIDSAADDLAAIAELQAELQAEADKLHPDVQARHAGVAEARALVAQDEFERFASTDLVDALEAFRLAIAKAYGAHHAAQRLRAQAASLKPENAAAFQSGVQRLDPLPALRFVTFNVPALGIEDILRNVPDMQVTNYNTVTLDFGQDAQRVSADAVSRLSR